MIQPGAPQSRPRQSTLLGHLGLGIVVAATIVLITLSPGALASSSIQLSLSIREEKAADALFLAALAAFFDLDSKAALEFHESAGPSSDPLETLMILYFSGLTELPAWKIRQERRRYSWEKIAQLYGLPENLRGKWVSNKAHGKRKFKRPKKFVPYTDAELRQHVFVLLMKDYYGITESELRLWFHRGLSYRDILLALNLAKLRGVRAAEIVELRTRGLPWGHILRLYRMTLAKTSRPAKPSVRIRIVLDWRIPA